MSTMRPETGLPEPLPSLLRTARERSGRSQRQLAEDMGVAHGTIAEAERARDPRHSTLESLLRVLPDLSPARLLGREGPRLPSGTALWRFHRERQGLVIGSLSVRLRAGSEGPHVVVTETARVRAVGADASRTSIRTSLMRAVFQGGSASMGRIEARDDEGAPLVIEEGATRHEFTFARDLEREGFTYRRTVPAPAHDAASEGDAAAELVGASVELPVERLVLEIEAKAVPKGRVPVLVAHAAPLSLDEPWMDVVARLHPRPRLRRQGAGWVALVRKPPLGVRFSLVARAPAPHVTTAKAVAPTHLARVLRGAREGAGLSQRQLAERLQVSAMTVNEVERGRDARHSVLVRYLDVLSSLAADELFEVAPTDAEATVEQAWWAWRALFGCEAESETKLLELTDSGDSTLTIATRRLRVLRDVTHPLRLRLGLARAVLHASRARLRALEVEEGARRNEVRITTMPSAGGAPLSVLAIPEPLAQRGVTFTRRLLHPGVYTMKAARARERTGEEGPFVEGTSFAALLPVRRLKLQVAFPRGYWPKELRVHAWPVARMPTPDEPDLSSSLLGSGLRLRESRLRGSVELVVELPLIGYKYGISWELP